MKIRLVSHASVIVECRDVSIWTDPWLFGKVFNDSWTLLPAPVFDESLLRDITHLWLSHEHPDHFHIPTLSSLPPHFKQNVIVMFQQRGSERAFATLEKLGFQKFLALPHRQSMLISRDTRVFCYQAGTMDSCLGIESAGETVFNVNDSRINSADCRVILRDLGAIDVLLNQFSLAVTAGQVDHRRYLAPAARHVLQSLSANHRDLRAAVTIPFASLMYWSAIDNRHVNAFANKPRAVFDFCAQRGQKTAILYPGDVYEVNRRYDSRMRLERYDELYARFDELPFDTPAPVPPAEIARAFEELARHLHDKFPRLLLRALGPLSVFIPDLETSVIFSVAHGWLREVRDYDAPDLRIHSQPLQFCFARPYGAQTLAISGRYQVLRHARRWRAYRALLALNNAEVYLRPRYLATHRNWAYLKDRFHAKRRYADRASAREQDRLGANSPRYSA
jgi:UDP-MurNAc hydroxylase